MSDFKFISANETYKALFYQLPKVLFESQKYMGMSNDSKIAYAMLKDRCEYSLQNNWVDENQNVYFIFTTEELMQLLCCGNKKVAKIKKELAEYNLLMAKRMPPKRLSDGSFLPQPTRLYLGQLELTATDVYTENKLDAPESNSQSVERTFSEEPHQINSKPQSVEKTFLEETASNQAFSQSVEKTRNLEQTNSKPKNNKDTKRLSEDEGKSLRDKLLLEDFAESMIAGNKTFLPSKVLTLLASFSHGEFETAISYMKAIHNAKANAEKLEDYHFMYEDVEGKYGIDIDNLIYFKTKKAIFKEKDEKVRNMDNLIFRYLTDLFQDVIRQIKATEESPEAPEVSLHNWLESD